MKKMFLGLAVSALAMAGVSKAHAGVVFSFSIPAPIVYAAPARVYVAPPPPRVVYAQPAPVVVYRPPVYCAPAPVYCAPAPVVRFGFGFGGYRPFYRHGCW